NYSQDKKLNQKISSLTNPSRLTTFLTNEGLPDIIKDFSKKKEQQKGKEKAEPAPLLKDLEKSQNSYSSSSIVNQ
ncbi:MAG: hypothetical protein Q4B50_08710, partial [Bacillota bacterium]|nr:hypothetical protein [Bacillota bacterium]